MLAAAEGNPINAFGELPDRGAVPYTDRTAAGLLRHTWTDDGADYDPDLDPTGERIVFCSTRHSPNPDLYIKHAMGTAVTQLTADPASDIHPAFSPDGQRVAFSSNRSGNWDIWIIGTDGRQPVQVTQGPADEVHPSWSPDGQRLVFCSLPPGGGQWELWVARAEAEGTKQFIGYGLFPEWSPKEDCIAYQRARERGSRWFSIWTMMLVDGEPRYPTEIVFSGEFAAISPTWSPDGTQLAFGAVGTAPADAGLGAPQETADIWVVNVDGTQRVRLTDGHSRNFGPVWAATGRVFFTSARSGTENVWSILPPGLSAPAPQAPASLARHQESEPATPLPGKPEPVAESAAHGKGGS